jgi:hypothetical protein
MSFFYSLSFYLVNQHSIMQPMYQRVEPMYHVHRPMQRVLWLIILMIGNIFQALGAGALAIFLWVNYFKACDGTDSSSSHGGHDGLAKVGSFLVNFEFCDGLIRVIILYVAIFISLVTVASMLAVGALWYRNRCVIFIHILVHFPVAFGMSVIVHWLFYFPIGTLQVVALVICVCNWLTAISSLCTCCCWREEEPEDMMVMMSQPLTETNYAPTPTPQGPSQYYAPPPTQYQNAPPPTQFPDASQAQHLQGQEKQPYFNSENEVV